MGPHLPRLDVVQIGLVGGWKSNSTTPVWATTAGILTHATAGRAKAITMGTRQTHATARLPPATQTTVSSHRVVALLFRHVSSDHPSNVHTPTQSPAASRAAPGAVFKLCAAQPGGVSSLPCDVGRASGRLAGLSATGSHACRATCRVNMLQGTCQPQPT